MLGGVDLSSQMMDKPIEEEPLRKRSCSVFQIAYF